MLKDERTKGEKINL